MQSLQSSQFTAADLKSAAQKHNTDADSTLGNALKKQKGSPQFSDIFNMSSNTRSLNHPSQEEGDESADTSVGRSDLENPQNASDETDGELPVEANKLTAHVDSKIAGDSNEGLRNVRGLPVALPHYEKASASLSKEGRHNPDIEGMIEPRLTASTQNADKSSSKDALRTAGLRNEDKVSSSLGAPVLPPQNPLLKSAAALPVSATAHTISSSVKPQILHAKMASKQHGLPPDHLTVSDQQLVKVGITRPPLDGQAPRPTDNVIAADHAQLSKYCENGVPSSMTQKRQPSSAPHENNFFLNSMPLAASNSKNFDRAPMSDLFQEPKLERLRAEQFIGPKLVSPAEFENDHRLAAAQGMPTNFGEKSDVQHTANRADRATKQALMPLIPSPNSREDAPSTGRPTTPAGPTDLSELKMFQASTNRSPTPDTLALNTKTEQANHQSANYSTIEENLNRIDGDIPKSQHPHHTSRQLSNIDSGIFRTARIDQDISSRIIATTPGVETAENVAPPPTPKSPAQYPFGYILPTQTAQTTSTMVGSLEAVGEETRGSKEIDRERLGSRSFNFAEPRQPSSSRLQATQAPTSKTQPSFSSDALIGGFEADRPLSDLLSQDDMVAVQALDQPRGPSTNPIFSIGKPELPVHVPRQLAEIVHTKRGQLVEVALSPEELGRVKLSISPGDSGIMVNIMAERPETLDLIRRHIDHLNQELQQLGYEDTGFSFNHEGDETPRDGNSSDTPRSEPIHDNMPLHQQGSESAPVDVGPLTNLDLRI